MSANIEERLHEMVRKLSSERVTVVTVTYNSTTVLPAMLSSVPKDTAIILIDNASDDPDAVSTLASQNQAQIILNKENSGFGVACNMGAAQAKTEFLLFLNPDARLLDGALDALVVAADTYPSASAFNPAITDKRDRPYFKRSSVLLPASTKMSRGWPASNREVPILTGAALFVRRTAFETVGGFDPQIFLYHEDDDLSLRLKASCGPLYFVRDARVTHDAGNASPRSPETAASKAFHMGCSRIYAARKHNLAGAKRKALFSAVFQIISPIALLSARKRAKQMAFLRGVLQGMKNETS